MKGIWKRNDNRDDNDYRVLLAYSIGARYLMHYTMLCQSYSSFFPHLASGIGHGAGYKSAWIGMYGCVHW